jgi:hypothetical protein
MENIRLCPAIYFKETFQLVRAAENNPVKVQSSIFEINRSIAGLRSFSGFSVLCQPENVCERRVNNARQAAQRLTGPDKHAGLSSDAPVCVSFGRINRLEGTIFGNGSGGQPKMGSHRQCGSDFAFAWVRENCNRVTRSFTNHPSAARLLLGILLVSGAKKHRVTGLCAAGGSGLWW